MISRLFDHWGISTADQFALLGLAPTSRKTLSRYRKGAALDNSVDLLGRAGHLLGIHKALRIMLPHNRDLVYKWVTAPNTTFDGKSPLEIMRSGYEGLLVVRRYLDAAGETAGQPCHLPGHSSVNVSDYAKSETM